MLFYLVRYFRTLPVAREVVLNGCAANFFYVPRQVFEERIHYLK
jgi:hypothetical protein